VRSKKCKKKVKIHTENHTFSLTKNIREHSYRYLSKKARDLTLCQNNSRAMRKPTPIKADMTSLRV